MDLEKEYRLLQSKIEKISVEIFKLKDEIMEQYDSDHLTSVLPHRKRRKSLAEKNVSDELYSLDALKCSFYQHFIFAREKENISCVFPSNDDEDYGVEIRRINEDRFKITKRKLPRYINPNKLISNDPINLDQLQNTLNDVQKCVISYENRCLQGQQLKDFPNKMGFVSVSNCTKVVTLNMLLEKKGQEYIVCVVILYTPLSFRPTKIEVQFVNKKSNEIDTNVNEKFKLQVVKKLNVFVEKELVTAYKQFFNL